MRSFGKPAVSSGLVLAAALVLMAQAPATGTTGRASGAPLQQRTTLGRPAPRFHLFGLPVVIDAPVARSYCGACAYTTFAGQPVRSAGAVVGEASGTMTAQ